MSIVRDLLLGGNCEGVDANPVTKFVDDFAGLASSSSGSASSSGGAEASSAGASAMQYSVPELQRIHSRASVLTRQMYPSESSEFVETQVASMLSSLGIDASRLPAGRHGAFSSAAATDTGSAGFQYEEDAVAAAEMDRDGVVDSESWESVYARFLQEHDIQNVESSTMRIPEYVYVDRSQNSYMGMGLAEAFQTGIQLFKDGELMDAIAALEASLHKITANSYSAQELENAASPSEIWQFLGVAHAECDDDNMAIAALNNAVTEDPSNLDALLELGVSYTNELDRFHALQILKSWLEQHPKYASLGKDLFDDPASSSALVMKGNQQLPSVFDTVTSRGLQEKLQAWCTRAVEADSEDADMHALLGILHNVSGSYDKAVDSFKTALRIHPRDYSLWNKVGATMANSSNSTEAVNAYKRALQLKPKYVRAWVNMGIAFSNQGNFESAIRCYAQALSLAHGQCTHVWDYVAIALSCLGRSDLVEQCAAHDLACLSEWFDVQGDE
eukprot:ANDGO_00491.mRNA.1 Peroxisome biogenesis protein 5